MWREGVCVQKGLVNIAAAPSKCTKTDFPDTRRAFAQNHRADTNMGVDYMFSWGEKAGGGVAVDRRSKLKLFSKVVKPVNFFFGNAKGNPLSEEPVNEALFTS
jgi:hypothetical protein